MALPVTIALSAKELVEVETVGMEFVLTIPPVVASLVSHKSPLLEILIIFICF